MITDPFREVKLRRQRVREGRARRAAAWQPQWCAADRVVGPPCEAVVLLRRSRPASFRRLPPTVERGGDQFAGNVAHELDVAQTRREHKTQLSMS